MERLLSQASEGGDKLKERPILFSTPMVQEILSGRKTMTRRVCKLETNNFDYDLNDKDYGPFLQDQYGESINVKEFCPYGQPGDRLYVKEAIKKIEWADGIDGIAYVADSEPVWDISRPCRWVWKNKSLPSMFMPKSIARIWLEVTSVRVERVQDISVDDVISEGLEADNEICNPDPSTHESIRNWNLGWAHHVFSELWDKINLKRGYGWDANPWVWCVSFRRVE